MLRLLFFFPLFLRLPAWLVSKLNLVSLFFSYFVVGNFALLRLLLFLFIKLFPQEVLQGKSQTTDNCRDKSVLSWSLKFLTNRHLEVLDASAFLSAITDRQTEGKESTVAIARAVQVVRKVHG